MSSSSTAVVITVLIALAGVAGDYFIKLASEAQSPFFNRNFALGFLIYALTAFGWVLVMPHLKLAYIGVVYSLTIVLCLCLLGVLVFGETLRPTEWLGVGLAIASLLLLHRVA